MNDSKNILEQKIKPLIFIWLVLIVELAIFFNLFYFFLAPKELVQSTDKYNIGFWYIAYLVAIVSIPVVSKIYSIFKNKALKEDDLIKKITLYKTAFIFKATILEFAGVLLLLAFYLNEIYSPLYLFAAIIIAFFFNKPSLSNFKNDFEIKEKSNDNTIIPMEDEKITSDTKF